jgi:hypothetical protein
VIYEATEELEHVLPPSRPSPPYHVAENTHARNFMNESANDCSLVVKQRVPQLGGAIKYAFRLSLFDPYSRVGLWNSHIYLVLTFCVDTGESKRQCLRKECLRSLCSLPSPSPLRLPQVDATLNFPVALIHLMRARRHDFKMDGCRPLKPLSSIAPALGPGFHPHPSLGHQYTELPSIERPITPVIPQTVHRPPTALCVCNVTPEILNPVAIEDRDAVACAWLLPLSVPLHEYRVLDVLATFQTATRAIRHVRSYVIDLSDWESHCHRSAPKEEYCSNVAARNAGRRLLPVIPSFER